MKKLLAAGAAGLVLLAGGSALGVRSVTDSAPCEKPITILGSEQTGAVQALEAYITENIAPKYQHPQYLNWESEDFNPVILPSKIAAHVVVYEGFGVNPKHYYVVVTRDCQGGEWEVLKFQPIK